eukprot:3499697-Rhodomonas_salina.4
MAHGGTAVAYGGTAMAYDSTQMAYGVTAIAYGGTEMVYSGTEMAYDGTYDGTEMAYGAQFMAKYSDLFEWVRPKVLILLRLSYAQSGTAMVYETRPRAIVLHPRYA